MFQTKLLFNEAIPASARNRASHVRLPAPIVIERLRPLPRSEDRENIKSPGSSISFTALSEERLQAAVKLAKRDMRHRRHKLLSKSPDRTPQETSVLETSAVEFQVPDEGPGTSQFKTKIKTSTPSRPATKPSALTTRNNPKFHPPKHLNGHSLPTKDVATRQEKTSLSWELVKLQNELKVFVQKVDELACRAGEIVEEPMEPDEEKKLDLRREKQAARSSRTIYDLQQQVKKIQEDMEMFRYQKIWDTKKSIAVNRLAAAHRGTLRALQVVIHQLSDISGGKLPPSYKELGQLIRQLSLCSAKVEAENGSAASDTVLSIMQKLQTLDSVYSKQMLEKQLQAHACSPRPKSSQPSMSPTRAPKGPSTSSAQPPQKPVPAKRDVRAEKIKTTRKHKAALPRFVLQRALRPKSVTAHRKGGAVRPVVSRAGVLIKNQNVGFQQPTVSSQLRVNQVPPKEHSVPWVPASPFSSPPRSSTQRCQTEPRCLFSPAKPSASPLKPKVVDGSAEAPLALSSETKKQAQKEALRKAWLDKMTMIRLKELNRLTKEETEHIQTLRSQVISQTRWAERAERRAGERMSPHVGELQLMGESKNRFCSPPRDRLQEGPTVRAVGGAAWPNEAQLENLLEDAAAAAAADSLSNFKLEDKPDHRLQTLTLERMLRHMEEIQRDQEEVRQRNASICYLDPLYWERTAAAAATAAAAGPWGRDLGSGPASPQPIRLTRPALKQTSAADIVLENPVETGLISDNSLAAEEEEHDVVAVSQDARQPRPTFPGPAEPSRTTGILVTSGMLENIRRYKAAYDTYLRDVSHEAVGSFDPWAVADSLADELLSDALAEVAAEFQDVVEEYAEAVFTSEFLQPIQSPPALATSLVSQ